MATPQPTQMCRQQQNDRLARTNVDQWMMLMFNKHAVGHTTILSSNFILIFVLFLYDYRFIGPFLETVNRWERNLALISEIIDEWLIVQRKWLYLEGIFIGGDIRSQLPEEAKKFDDIDKAYRRVSNGSLLITIRMYLYLCIRL